MKSLLKFSPTQVKTALDDMFNNASNASGKFSGQHPANTPFELPVFNAIEQQSMAYSSMLESNAEYMRMMGGSGVFSTRQYTVDVAFDSTERPFGVNYAAIVSHNHGNYRGMPGMGEFTAMLNGYYVRTQHNDYRIFGTVQGNYLARKEIMAPSIPDAVKAMPIGEGYGGTTPFAANTQMEYMKNVYTNDKANCVFFLSYLEAWWETYANDDVGNNTDSFRHSTDASSMREILEKAIYFNAGGHKNRLENIPFTPIMVRRISNTGVPVICVLRYRINTYPVGTLSSTDQFNVSMKYSDGTSFTVPKLKALPFTESQATTRSHIAASNVFLLRKDLRTKLRGKSTTRTWNDVTRSSSAIFDLPPGVLHELCEMCPGMMGHGASLTETYTQYGLDDVLTKYGTTLDMKPDLPGVAIPYNPPQNVLNAAYYNKRYTFVGKDASGRTNSSRGFNDPNLYVASTTNPKVVDGFSYMIPIELVLRTPRENFDPYNVSKTTKPTGLGTAASPYSHAYFSDYHFTIPSSLYSADGTISINGTDLADTDNQAYVTTPADGVQKLAGAGIRIFDIDDNKVTKTGHRCRFPVFYEYQDFSKPGGDIMLLKRVLQPLLKKIRAGTATDAEIDDVII